MRFTVFHLRRKIEFGRIMWSESKNEQSDSSGCKRERGQKRSRKLIFYCVGIIKKKIVMQSILNRRKNR